MRISDWSSDVCSSDLIVDDECAFAAHRLELLPFAHRADAQRKQRQCAAYIYNEKGEDEAAPLRIDRERMNAGQNARAHKESANHRHRSEEHTSELQSLMRISYAVFCLKKKKKTTQHNTIK